MDTTPLQTAIERAGSAAALARICDQRPQAVTRWKREDRVPAKHCRAIEAATGVSVHELRPDVFGPAPEISGIDKAVA